MSSLTFRALPDQRAPSAAGCPDWQTAVAEAVRSPAELCRLAGLSPATAAEAESAAAGFPLLVPRPFLARIRPGDAQDPLLLQVLPRAAEQAEDPRYRTDPLGEAGAACCPGLLAKYHGRSLMVTTGACGVHCRFCFRRHFPYFRGADFKSALHRPFRGADFQSALEHLAADGSIREVILSGGDPLSLPDRHLARLAGRLAEIPHLRRLRVHTRLPVVIPQRVTGELMGWLRGTRLSPIVVVHVNHPAEIDAAVAAAFGRLLDAGIPVLSQGVLLRGINDRLEVLAELYQRLVDLRVMPYYLHQLDPVAAVAHFEVPEATGIALMAQLRAQLPGYAVPRYVRETPGAASKEVLA